MAAFNSIFTKKFSPLLSTILRAVLLKHTFLLEFDTRWAEISLGARWMPRHPRYRMRWFRLIVRRTSIDIRMENFRYIEYRIFAEWTGLEEKREKEFLAREFTPSHTLQTFSNLLPDHFFTLFPLEKTFQREKFSARVERTNLAWLLLSIKSKSSKRKVFIARR